MTGAAQPFHGWGVGPPPPSSVDTPLFDELARRHAHDEVLAGQGYPANETEHRHDAELPDDLRRVEQRGMIASPNHSSRAGAKVRLLVIHTAEGARTVESLGAYFANSAHQVSSHVGIDDCRIEQYVDFDQAAWTVRKANPFSENAELCGFAAWDRDEWMKHRGMLDLTAQWIAERARARGIPLRKITGAQAAAGQSGVIGHVDWTLGAHDGTHTDPGKCFPWDYVMARATASPPKENRMIVINKGIWEPGNNMRQTLACPVGDNYLCKDGYFSLGVGWEDATDVQIVFVGARKSGGERVYLGGIGPNETLPYDDWHVLPIPRGTTLISVAYTSKNPIGWCTELSTERFR